MNQRGFISSLYIYLILAALISGLGYFLYNQIQKNGKLEATISVQNAALEEAERLRKSAEDAVKIRDESITKTRTEINRYRSKLKDLEAKYAEVSAWANQPLPDPVVKLLCELTGSHSEKCLPATDTKPVKAVTGMEREHERRPAELVAGSR